MPRVSFAAWLIKLSPRYIGNRQEAASTDKYTRVRKSNIGQYPRLPAGNCLNSRLKCKTPHNYINGLIRNYILWRVWIPSDFIYAFQCFWHVWELPGISSRYSECVRMIQNYIFSFDNMEKSHGPNKQSVVDALTLFCICFLWRESLYRKLYVGKRTVSFWHILYLCSGI